MRGVIKKTALVELTRGCPYKCTYCANVFFNKAFKGTNKETGNQYKSGSRYYTKLCFSGMVVAADLYEVLLQDPIMKREFLTRDLIVDWCVEHHILWPNGNPTKQIKLPINTHPRAYLIKDFEIGGGDFEMNKPKPITNFASPTTPLTIPKKLSNCSEGELGDHYYFHT